MLVFILLSALFVPIFCNFHNDSTVSIVVDPNEKYVYVGTYNGHIYQYVLPSGPWLTFASLPEEVFALQFSPNGTLYVQTVAAVYVFLPNNKHYSVLIKYPYLYNMILERTGSILYVGTMDGVLLQYNVSNGIVNKYTADATIRALGVDSKGTVYAGTFDGNVWQLSTVSGEVYWRVLTENMFESGCHFEAVVVDKDDNAYASLTDFVESSPARVFKWVSATNSWVLWSNFTDNVKQVLNLYFAPNGYVYGVTVESQVWRKDAMGMEWEQVGSSIPTSGETGWLTVDSNQNVYVTTWMSGEVVKYTAAVNEWRVISPV